VKEALFGPAMTGPIDDPRAVRAAAAEMAATLFDEKTRERLQRLAGALQYSPVELIREGTLRYLDEIENDWATDHPIPQAK
jgi:hypothetical protein